MDSDNPTPVRVSVLHEAARLTNGDRDREYGTPVVNLSLAGEFKRLAVAYAKREFSPAEGEAISMILTKLARYVTGTPKRDTCVDMAAYAAILWEVSQSPAAPQAPEAPEAPTPDRPRRCDGCECEGEDDHDETFNWSEFFDDYGAVDDVLDDVSTVSRQLKKAVARALARRKAAKMENELREAMRAAGIEHVTFQLSFD